MGTFFHDIKKKLSPECLSNIYYLLNNESKKRCVKIAHSQFVSGFQPSWLKMSPDMKYGAIPSFGWLSCNAIWKRKNRRSAAAPRSLDVLVYHGLDSPFCSHVIWERQGKLLIFFSLRSILNFHLYIQLVNIWIGAVVSVFIDVFFSYLHFYHYQSQFQLLPYRIRLFSTQNWLIGLEE